MPMNEQHAGAGEHGQRQGAGRAADLREASHELLLVSADEWPMPHQLLPRLLPCEHQRTEPAPALTTNHHAPSLQLQSRREDRLQG